MIIYISAFLCVLGLAIGQVLFKYSASALKNDELTHAVAFLLSAMCIYGITSVAWVFILQKNELGRVYPIMALAFILVPIGSHIAFGEKFQPQYFIGVALIMAGIIIAIRS